MTKTEKLEKLTAFLKADIESTKACSDSLARSKDYIMAQKFLQESRVLQTILWMLEDEEFLQKQWEVFYKNMEKSKYETKGYLKEVK